MPMQTLIVFRPHGRTLRSDVRRLHLNEAVVVITMAFYYELIKTKSSMWEVVRKIRNSLLVTTPSRRMMLGWSNWPMMLASLRKSLLCRSTWPPFSVLIATGISLFPGVFKRPLQTSPNSPYKTKQKTFV